MKTDFFIKQTKLHSKDLDKYLAERIVKQYVPYQNKLAMCKTLVKFTSSYTDEGSNTTIYCRNTPARFLNFVLTLINEYTDIEINFNDSVEEYNLLDEYDFVNKLVSLIPEHEYSTWNTLLKMVDDDEYENNRSLVSLIDGARALLSSEELKNKIGLLLTPEQ